MKNTIWNKRIPTLLSIGLIAISIVITSILAKNGTGFISRASPTQTPQDVRITNVSDNSFTISYTTEEEVIGSINFGEDKNLGLTALDDRDQKGAIAPHKIHSITAKNLKPKTLYFFSITSGQNIFLNNNVPFEISTGPIIETGSLQQTPINGNIILPDGGKPSEALVYITNQNTQVISSLLKPDGSYSIPLNSLLINDLSSYFTFNKNDIIKMLIVAPILRSNVLVSYEQINPLPTITLSNDYDFTVNNMPVASISAKNSGFPSFATGILPVNQTPNIITPKKDQGFTDQQPLFRGVASPNEKVQIIIRSPIEIQTQVTADSFGNWTYRPTSAISPGPHTITVQTINTSGILKTITQSFVVYAAGTQVSQSATPSATPIVITPSPTLTPTPIPTLTQTPILSQEPTIIPALPTIAPSPTIFTQIPLGNSSIAIAGFFGIAVIITGILLFAITRGGISS